MHRFLVAEVFAQHHKYATANTLIKLFNQSPVKKNSLYFLLISLLPVCASAQYTGGNGNGEIIESTYTVQLNGDSAGLYSGSNGRGEVLDQVISNQLNGDTANLYGGSTGRGKF